MAKVFIEETSLTAIGNAIRAKTGGTDMLTVPTGMVNAIASITTGGGEVVDSHAWEDWRLSGNSYIPFYFNDRITYLDVGGLAGAKITNVNLPNVEGLGEISLAKMSSLSNVNIPKVTRIYTNAFQNTGDYNNGFDMSAPEVTYIDSYAFYNSYLKAAIFPKVTELNGDMFYGNQKLMVASFPSLVTSGNFVNAFNYCGNLKCVDMPKFTEIPYGTFGQNYDTTSLQYLTLPGCTRVSGSFQGAYGLLKIDLGQCQNIGSYTFDCPNLNTLVLRYNGVCNLEQSATAEFSSTKICSDKTGYVYVPAAQVNAYKTATNWVSIASQIRAIEDYENELIFGCIYDESITEITDAQYQTNKEITGVHLSNLTTMSNASIFNQCSNLVYANLPAATSIQGFYACENLQYVSAPEALTLKDHAFYRCSKLTKLDFPKMNMVNSNAFEGCDSLNALIFRRTANMVYPVSDPWGSNTSYPTLYVPAALISKYQENQYWSKCTIEPIEGSIYEEV